MSEIIPGILENNWESLEQKIKRVLPIAKTIQIDVVDGSFALNTTLLDLSPCKKYEDKIFLEAHLMVNEPIDYVERLAKSGFRRFIGHIEKMSSQKDFIDHARKFGEAGLAIDISSKLDRISMGLNSLDCFLLMSIKAGFSGQNFLPKALEKIKTLRAKTEIPIEVDGGINEETIVPLKDIGVNRVVITSSLFKARDIALEYQKLQSLFT